MNQHERTICPLSHCFLAMGHGLYETLFFCARGYFASTMGIDEHIVRRYVKHQHHHNEVEQPSLFDTLTS